jgi:hypothetical protein
MADYPMPGQNEFTAEEEKAIRQLAQTVPGPIWKPPPIPKYAIDPKNKDSWEAMK